MQPEIAIWGASQHALVVADIIRRAGTYQIAGFLDDVDPKRRGEPFAGAQVLGGREMLPVLLERGVRRLAFGFGLYAPKPACTAAAAGFDFPVLIDPGAYVGDGVQPGPGTVIKNGAVVEPGVRIGAHVILGANTIVTHGCELADGVRLAAGAVLGARVRIGRGALIGLHATVRGGVVIGAGALAGAGAVVLVDFPANRVAAGNPARVIREVRPDDF